MDLALLKQTVEQIEPEKKRQLDATEKITTLKETLVLPLKEKLADLKLTVRLILAGASAVSLVLTFFGATGYINLKQLIEREISRRIEEPLQYTDRFARALTLVNAEDYRQAIFIFSELFKQRPMDEVVFYNLLHSYAQLEDYDAGYVLVKSVKDENKLFPRLQSTWSFNNMGVILFVKGLQDPRLLSEAFQMFRESERIARRDGDPAEKYSAGNLFWYYLAAGDRASALSHLERRNQIESSDFPKWVEGEFKAKWFKVLEKKVPDVESKVKEILKSAKRPGEGAAQ